MRAAARALDRCALMSSTSRRSAASSSAAARAAWPSFRYARRSPARMRGPHANLMCKPAIPVCMCIFPWHPCSHVHVRSALVSQQPCAGAYFLGISAAMCRCVLPWYLSSQPKLHTTSLPPSYKQCPQVCHNLVPERQQAGPERAGSGGGPGPAVHRAPAHRTSMRVSWGRGSPVRQAARVELGGARVVRQRVRVRARRQLGAKHVPHLRAPARAGLAARRTGRSSGRVGTGPAPSGQALERKERPRCRLLETLRSGANPTLTL